MSIRAMDLWLLSFEPGIVHPMLRVALNEDILHLKPLLSHALARDSALALLLSLAHGSKSLAEGCHL